MECDPAREECFLRHSDMLHEVYECIYKGQAQFNLIALPRLEIQGMEDLKTLHEIGVLQPDHAVQLSDVLLGVKRRKQQSNTVGNL